MIFFNKPKNKIFIFLIVLEIINSIFISYAFDLEISQRARNINTNVSCENLFEIRNLDYYSNKTTSNFTLRYFVEYNSSILKAENLQFNNFKFRKYSATGEFIPKHPGTYEICGEVISSSHFDQNESNNKLCYKLNLSENKKKCDFSIDIELENNGVFLKNNVESEVLKFKPIAKNIFHHVELNESDADDFDFKIEYWIEDLEKKTLKPKRNTSVNSYKSFRIKSYTPLGLIIKAKVSSLSCNDINLQNNYFEIPILFQNEIEQNKKIVKIKNIKQISDEIILLDFSVFRNMTNKNLIKIFLTKNNQKISNDFQIKVNSHLQDIAFEIPLLFSNKILNNGKNTINIVFDVFGKKYEEIIGITINKTESHREKENRTNFSNSTKKFNINEEFNSTEKYQKIHQNKSNDYLKKFKKSYNSINNSKIKNFLAFVICCLVILIS